jgi:signal transduction histidine kinase
LRRLERDLHGGPQQHLLRVGLDLSAAQRRLAEGDVTEAAAIVAQARALTEATATELRLLVRGVAPPILADRGLVPALTAVAAASPIPATLTSAINEGLRFPPAVERTCYFAVTEAVANAAKHSGAARIDIQVTRQDGWLIAAVHDDGRGGAVVIPGHGLAGLADRAAGIDGRLTVTSPAGGGTTVELATPGA